MLVLVLVLVLALVLVRAVFVGEVGEGLQHMLQHLLVARVQQLHKRPARVVLGRISAPFPPAASHRLLLSALITAIEWPGKDPWR